MANHAFRVPVAAPGFVVSTDPTNAAEPTAGTIAADTIAADTIAADTIAADTIAADTIAEATSAAGVTVDGCLIKDGRAAALATASMFLSTEQTGTGSAQNVAHGLGAVPTMTFAVITGGHNGIGGAGNQCPIFTYGTHTSTNCVFTTEAGTTFRVVAFK